MHFRSSAGTPEWPGYDPPMAAAGLSEVKTLPRRQSRKSFIEAVPARPRRLTLAFRIGAPTMQPNDQLRGLLDQLLAAHSEGLKALNIGTPIREQRAAAKRLSNALRAAADTPALWAALAPTEAANDIAPHQRAELRRAIADAAVGFPWTDLLDPIGYQPPPTIDEWNNSFAEAVNNPRDGDFNREALSGEFRDFAERLNDLSKDPNSTPRRLRRGIWGAVKKAGSLAVGISVGVAAAPYVLPTATVIAALPAVAALGLPAAVVSDVLIEAGKEAVVSVIKKIKKPPRPRDIPGHPAFVALGLADYISEPALLGLRRAWIRRYDEGDRIIATRSFIKITRRRLAAINARTMGATWFSDQAGRYYSDISQLLNRLEATLDADRPARADVVAILGTLAQRVPALKAAMRQCISPLDPPAAHNADIATTERLIAELDTDRSLAKEQTGPARTNLSLATQGNPPDGIRVAACQSIYDECVAVSAALDRLHATAVDHCAQLKAGTKPS